MDTPTFLTGKNEEIQNFLELQNQELIDTFTNVGWKLEILTNAIVTQITDMNYTPILPFGTIWANSDEGKLQFISVAAVAGTSDATVETITSA
jgi:hypothetical protein